MALYQQNVVQGGLWSNTYAATNTNFQEHFAEGVGAFYGEKTEGPVGGDGVQNDINTRAKLLSYDPELYDLITKVFPSDVTDFPCPTNTACDYSSYVCPTITTVVPAQAWGRVASMIQGVRGWAVSRLYGQ